MAELDLPPTPRQREVLRVIATHRKVHGHSPTITELGQQLEISSRNGVVDHLKALSRRGLLTWLPKRARTLALTPRARQLLGLAAALSMVLFAGCAPRPAPCVCIAPPAPSCAPAWNQAELAASLLADCRGALLACQSRGGGR